MKDKKGTEFEQALYASIEQMKEEFKVVGNSLKLEKEMTAKLRETVKQSEIRIKAIREDLEMSTHMYGRESTRKIARDAFNQSTAKANWASLEDHPVVKNLYLAIRDSRKDLGRSIQENALRLDQAQPANEVIKALENTAIIKNVIGRLDDFDGHLQILRDDTENSFTRANKHDMKLRDKLADLETAQDALEFIQSETILTQDSANMFMMGAWARSGHEKVAEGIREILKKPKEEKKQDEIA